MNDQPPNPIQINQWISPGGKTFSYRLFWPYKDVLDTKTASVDVYVRKEDFLTRQYVGTFVTWRELLRLKSHARQQHFYADGTYLPLTNDILINEISPENIEVTLEDLLRTGEFEDYFEEAKP